MPSCRQCKAELKWPQPYVKGARPVNQDGSNHDCGFKTRNKSKLFGYYPEEGYIRYGNLIVHKHNIEEYKQLGWIPNN